MNNSISVFFQFLLRDFYVYKSQAINYAINNSLIYPVLFALSIGYVQPSVYFPDATNIQGSALFIGHILIIVLVFANTVNVSLLFDLEHTRFIDYQLILLAPRLIIIERILFAALFTFLISIPYFPIAKIVLGSSFNTDQASWPLTYLLLLASCVCCSAYTMFIACYLPNSRQLRTFWMRINFPLITFGGLFIPWIVVNKLSSILGTLVLFNPLIYITEGLRFSILAQNSYLNAWVCIGALFIFSCIFTLLAWHYFKKRVDHI